MRKAKLALTALMIGTLTMTGTSFAEAGAKLDDIQIGVRFKNEHQPPAPERREAPRPPEAYRRDGHKGSHDAPPPPHPVKGHDPHHGTHGSRYHHQGHDVPPPPHGPHHGGYR